MCPESSFCIAINCSDAGKMICRHDVIVKFFDGFLFLLSSLVTVPSFMSMSSPVLEL